MVVVSGHREGGQLCAGRSMMIAAEEASGSANAHRHLIRWPPFFELRGGWTMAHRPDVAWQRASFNFLLLGCFYHHPRSAE